MINAAQADQFRADIVRLYDNFALTLTGRYLAIQAAAGTPAPAFYIEQFKSLARGHVGEFIKGADNLIAGWASAMGDGDDVAGRMCELQSSLRVIVLTNTRDLSNRLVGGNAGLKTLFNRPMGAIGNLLQQKLASPELKSVDDAGRLWDSSKLVGLIGRDFAYQSLIDVRARTLAAESDVAQVIYEDSEHPFHGLKVSLTGDTPDLPSLANVRKVIFHPNATASLTHV